MKILIPVFATLLLIPTLRAERINPDHARYECFDLFHLYSYNPTQPILTNNPFRLTQSQLKKYQKKRSDLRKKGSTKSFKYKKIKDKIVELEKKITSVYHQRLCGDTTKFFEINEKVRHHLRLKKQNNNSAENEKLFEKYIAQGQDIIQKMIDTVVIHQPLPKEYAALPTKYKNFYRDLSDKVHKNNKKR